VAAGWSNVFNFTVPTNATTGLVNMRVRISFSDATQGGAPIDPCAAATYGETEDYTVTITGPAGIDGLDANLVSIFPNPTDQKVTISLGELAKETNQIDVIDITGKTVSQLSQFNGSMAELELNNLAKGIYHVVISTNYGTITKQVIKQ
ncbi:MAG: T9SS type A sorting domain-containing protein, partial [Flavobacteriales bacterium]